MSKLHIVWFKHDLRVHDHAPLKAACLSGEPVLALYILPPDGDAPLDKFLAQSLRDLDEALTARGGRLTVRTGHAVDIFSELYAAHGISAIHMHSGAPETADAAEAELRAWALRAGVPLRAHTYNAVERGLSRPEDQQALWRAYLVAPRIKAPELIAASPVHGEALTDGSSDLAPGAGGRKAGAEAFNLYLSDPFDLASGVSPSTRTERAARARVLPYIEAGILSVREVWQSAISQSRQHQMQGRDEQARVLRRFADGTARQYGPVDYYSRLPNRSDWSQTARARMTPRHRETAQLSLDLRLPTGASHAP